MSGGDAVYIKCEIITKKSCSFFWVFFYIILLKIYWNSNCYSQNKIFMIWIEKILKICVDVLCKKDVSQVKIKKILMWINQQRS